MEILHYNVALHSVIPLLFVKRYMRLIFQYALHIHRFRLTNILSVYFLTNAEYG